MGKKKGAKKNKKVRKKVGVKKKMSSTNYKNMRGKLVKNHQKVQK